MYGEVKVAWKVFESLREHSVKIINSKKKDVIPLTTEKYKSCLNQTQSNSHICKKSCNINKLMIKFITRLGTIAIILVNTEVLHIAYVI